MGHENLAGLSPAHRRNQNPVSPSASMFRRSATQTRGEADVSWMALIRRHRFLLFMLALLAFLCTVYLYFAITLGADKCSSLSGNEKALCRLKKSKTKVSHGRKTTRGLLSVQDSSLKLFSTTQVEPEVHGNAILMPDGVGSSQTKQIMDAASWLGHVSLNGQIQEPAHASSILAQHVVSDGIKWKEHTAEYKDMLGTSMSKQIQNVLDMNPGLGSFAAGLLNDPIWEINVLPVGRFTIFFTRHGNILPAPEHDWCVAFPSPPGTYDLVHASGVLEVEEKRCGMLNVLSEVDRLLRPAGCLIIRDVSHVVERAQRSAKLLSWQELAKAGDEDNTETIIIFCKR